MSEDTDKKKYGSLICPICDSTNNKRIPVLSDRFVAGGQECLDCGYVGPWLTFTSMCERVFGVSKYTIRMEKALK